MTVGSWPLVPLRDVLTLAADVHRVDPTEVYPIAGVYGFGRGIICRPSISGLEIEADRLYRVMAGQFIYSRLKSFEGAFAIVPEEANGFFVSNEFPTFDVAQDRLLPGFLRWWFQIPAVWQALAGEGRGIGARRERLHPEQLLAHHIPLPPLGAQRGMVARLDAATKGITRRKGLMTEVGGELDALLASSFDQLVEDAPLLPMDHIAPLVRRSVPIQTDAMYTEIGVRSFFRGTFHRRTLSGAEFTWQKLFRVAKGDLVFSNLMAWEQGIAVAGPTDDGCVGNHRMLTCEADLSRILPGFLWFYFTTPAGFAKVVAASPGSIARNKTLSAEDLPNITVPVPSLDAQAWFVALHGKIEVVRKIQAEVTSELAQLTPTLLEAAFGSIDDFEQAAA